MWVLFTFFFFFLTIVYYKTSGIIIPAYANRDAEKDHEVRMALVGHTRKIIDRAAARTHLKPTETR